MTRIEIMKELVKAYPYISAKGADVVRDTVTRYMESLKDISDADLQRGIKKAIEASVWFPSVAELRQHSGKPAQRQGAKRRGQVDDSTDSERDECREAARARIAARQWNAPEKIAKRIEHAGELAARNPQYAAYWRDYITHAQGE